jgi:hypothetical protein
LRDAFFGDDWSPLALSSWSSIALSSSSVFWEDGNEGDLGRSMVDSSSEDDDNLDLQRSLLVDDSSLADRSF